MVFSSLTFLFFFLPIVLLTYFAVPMKAKNIIILISSLFFYAWGEPFYILIMLFSTVLDYTIGRLMDKFDDKPKQRTLFLILSVVMNLGLLSVFKYGSFFITNINSIFGANIFDPELALPIGISFYTFQSMSYTIDLYMRNIKVQKNIISFASYVTLFPQIVAGPIVRYKDVANEIDSRIINTTKVAEGIGMFVKGLGKKVILANNIGIVWTQIKAMDYAEIPVLTAWIGIIAFAFQIYYDFSGYSDMAVGLGKMLGFNFPENFNYPYVSKSISEFWRRWHMTLGSWFRSYVYIPLGGNRVSNLKTLRNLLIVWTLTGFWHGASWNFVIWGLYFGVLIVLERFVLKKVMEKIPKILLQIYTFVLVLIGWVFFDIEGLANAKNYLGAMFGSTGIFVDKTTTYIFMSNALLFIICIIGSTEIVKKVYNKLISLKGNVIQYAVPIFQFVILIICTTYLVDATYNPFLYFRF